jgi:hypothetical protein
MAQMRKLEGSTHAAPHKSGAQDYQNRKKIA